MTAELQRTATVNGGGEWYFASEPFVVKPARPSGQQVTWRDDGSDRGKPTRKLTGGANSTGTNGGGGGDGSGSRIVGDTESTASATTTKNGGGRLWIGYRAEPYWTLWMGCIGWAVCIVRLGGLGSV